MKRFGNYYETTGAISSGPFFFFPEGKDSHGKDQHVKMGIVMQDQKLIKISLEFKKSVMQKR